MSDQVANLLQYNFMVELMALPFIQTIYLYGSRARGDHTKTSDIDLAVACPTATPEDWFKIEDILENADTLLKIDCVCLEQINEDLKKNIYREGIKIYERN